MVPVPVITLDSAESYSGILYGYTQKFPPGTGFSYCNGGFCTWPLLAERAAAEPFHDLVRRLVIEPAGRPARRTSAATPCPGDAAFGYLHGADHEDALRTNLLTPARRRRGRRRDPHHGR